MQGRASVKIGGHVIPRFTLYVGLFSATIAVAQSDCPSKIKDEQSPNCELFNSKPDTSRLIFTIMFTRPHFSEEDTPENRSKLRKWTDSLYQNFDLRYIYAPNERAEPPPDSLLDWVAQWLYAEKSEAISISALDFISQLSYRDEPPSVSTVRSGNLSKPQQGGTSELVDLNGRFISQERLKGNLKAPNRQLIIRGGK
jgi:hypothetical protein